METLDVLGTMDKTVLSTDKRELIVKKRYLDGQAYGAIARDMRCGLSTVKRVLRRFRTTQLSTRVSTSREVLSP